jgi:16S rRNA U1498 N3-methylase RsmE
MPEKKLERLSKIALEATEQSYGYVVSSISFVTNITEYIKNSSVYILHQA